MSKPSEKVTIWTKNFIIITIINFLIYSSWQMFPSALPPYVKSLGGSASILGFINGIATISTLIIRPFSGIIMDRFGRKGIFTFGLVLMAISVAGYAIWPFVGAILAVRFIHGLAWGISSTASNTIASELIPSSVMAKGMNSFSLSISISSAIAPALALSLKTKTMIWTGVALIVASLILNFSMDYPKNISSPAVKSAPYEKASLLPSVLMFFVTVTYGAIVTFIALYANLEGIGMFFTLYAVGMLITRPFLGNLIHKKGFTPPIIIGGIISASSLLMLSFANNFTFFMACGLLYGIGYGMLHTSLQTMSVTNIPKNRLGAANATFLTGFDGGMGVGSIVAGIIGSKIGYGSMYATMSICIVFTLVLYIVFKKK